MGPTNPNPSHVGEIVQFLDKPPPGQLLFVVEPTGSMAQIETNFDYN